jgi:hypothetical protein
MKASHYIVVFLIALTALSCERVASRLSPLASSPDWSRLDPFQETMTRPEFEDLLKTVYSEGGAVPNFISLYPDHAVIKKSPLSSHETYLLRFASSLEYRKIPPHYWRESPLFFPSGEKPLKGLRIALDPGHIGGEWAKLEQRWFQIGNTTPVAEGELTLTVAKLLSARLQSLGAEVQLARSDLRPVSPLRPEGLMDEARRLLKERGVSPILESYQTPDDPRKENSVQWESELLAYLNGEIRERARIVNEMIRPDLTLCLHFDAQRWPDPKKPSLLRHNQFHLLIPGSYTAEELQWEDVRLEMLIKLMNRSHFTEKALAEKLAPVIATLTGQLPGNYPPEAPVKKVDTSGYIWTRHLLANRLYQNPVIFLEPYTMNDEEVFQRIQAGDYAGERIIGGIPRKSLFREYADAVVAGLLGYYSVPPNVLASGK